MKLTVWAPFGASAASRYCASVRNRNSSARLCTAIRERKGNTAPPPTGFAEIVSDDFREYFTQRILSFFLHTSGSFCKRELVTFFEAGSSQGIVLHNV